MDDKNNNHKDYLKNNENKTAGIPYIALGIALGVAFGSVFKNVSCYLFGDFIKKLKVFNGLA